MTEVVVWVLVSVSVVVQALSVLGFLVARGVYDRLHFTGPASTVAPVLVVVAIVADEGPLSQAAIKSVLTALLVLFLNGVLVHATARAIRIREHGGWRLAPEERAEAERP